MCSPPSWAAGLRTGEPGGLCPALAAVFLHMGRHECYFINGTEKVMSVQRYIYNRETYVVFESDVGVHVGFTSYEERFAREINSDPKWMVEQRTAVDWYCRGNYEVIRPFTVARRGERGAERVPSGPALPVTLEPLDP
uniref:MHC class II beta chain N-terminal domain-containing protein n=1 Tax=Zonotrichia albicollis TaxID=44394 RepID=A0A8D2M504_ZONAL